RCTPSVFPYTPLFRSMTDGDHILVTHRPDGAGSAHSVQEMNMSTAQTRRMRTGKFFGGFDTGGRNAGSRSFTHEQLTFGQVRVRSEEQTSVVQSREKL